MHIRLYIYSKRSNSTQQPENDEFNLAFDNAKINDANSSIMSPIVTIPQRMPKTVNETVIVVDVHPEKYNYMFIDEFSRYYYINDWVYNGNGTWSAHCSVDVLASWRSNIFESYGFVIRTAHPNYFNAEIIDDFYPASNGYTILSNITNLGIYTLFPSAATFVLGVIEDNNPKFGAVNYYVMSQTELQKLVNNMISPYVTAPATSWQETPLTSDMLKTIVSPMQYIVSCKWLPYVANNVPITTETSIKLGAWDTGAKGKQLGGLPNSNVTHDGEIFNGVTLRDTITITAPTVSESTVGTSEFINAPPYASYNLLTSMFGSIPIDPVIASHTTVYTAIFITNLISGTVSLKLQAPNTNSAGINTYKTIYYGETNLAIDIPIADVSSQYIDMAKTAVNMLGDAWSTTNLIDPAKRIASAVNNGIDMLKYTFNQSVVSAGTVNGAFSSDLLTFDFQIKLMHIFPRQPLLWGHPYNDWGKIRDFATRTIDETTGIPGYYAQISPVHLPTVALDEFGSADYSQPSMLKEEATQIKDTLLSGVFLF